MNGSNFVSGYGVRWNGEDRTTTFVSATQLTAAITAADIAAPGTASVTVQNQGGASNALPFTITADPPLSPTLLTGLVAYWNLDEASGTTRVGSVGFNLSDVNTVGSTTGKVGNAADFETSQDDHLRATDAAASVMDFSGNQDFTIAFWLQTESQPGDMSAITNIELIRRMFLSDFYHRTWMISFHLSGDGTAFTRYSTTANVGLRPMVFRCGVA